MTYTFILIFYILTLFIIVIINTILTNYLYYFLYVFTDLIKLCSVFFMTETFRYFDRFSLDFYGKIFYYKNDNSDTDGVVLAFCI